MAGRCVVRCHARGGRPRRQRPGSTTSDAPRWSERVDVALALGRHNELVPDLERAVAADPLDEHVLGQLMLALYRERSTGRRACALPRRPAEARPRARNRAGGGAACPRAGDPAAGPGRCTSGARGDSRPRHCSTSRGGSGSGWEWRPWRSLGAATAAVAMTLGEADRGAAAPIRGNAVAVVDAATARLLGSIPLESRPAAIAYGAGSIWVAYPDTRSVARISPVDRRVVASITLDAPAQDLEATAGDSGRSARTRPTPSSRSSESTRRSTPSRGSGDCRWWSRVTAGRSPRVETRSSSRPAPGTSRRSTRAAGACSTGSTRHAAPTAVAQGFGSSWLVYREANLVVRVDATGAITPIPVGRGPSAITVGRQRRLGRRCARRHRQVDRPSDELRDHDGRGRNCAGCDRGRRRERLGGERRRRDADAHRRAHEPGRAHASPSAEARRRSSWRTARSG